jgi:DNA segregation ATPase FtsK/SpoIIIE, S-DNA-T family
MGSWASRTPWSPGVPRIDGVRDGVDLQPGVEDFVMQVKQAWRFRPCSKVPI